MRLNETYIVAVTKSRNVHYMNTETTVISSTRDKRLVYSSFLEFSLFCFSKLCVRVMHDLCHRCDNETLFAQCFPIILVFMFLYSHVTYFITRNGALRLLDCTCVVYNIQCMNITTFFLQPSNM